MISPFKGGRHPLEVSSLLFLGASAAYQLGGNLGLYHVDRTAASVAIPHDLLLVLNLSLLLVCLGTLFAVFTRNVVSSHVYERAGCWALGGIVGFYGLIILSYVGFRALPSMLIILSLAGGYVGRAVEIGRTLKKLRGMLTWTP